MAKIWANSGDSHVETVASIEPRARLSSFFVATPVLGAG